MSNCIDLRIDASLVTHPKTKKLRRLAGDAAFVSLIAIWAFARRHKAATGSFAGMPDDEIEDAAEWSGAPGSFISAMIAARFMSGAPGARQLHDWTEHQPYAAGSEARSLQARWAAVCKWRGPAAADIEVPGWAAVRAASGQQAPGTPPAVPPASDQDSGQDTGSDSGADTGSDAVRNADRMRTASAPDAVSNAPSPSPLPTQDQKRVRESAGARESDRPPIPGAGSATVVMLGARSPPAEPRPRTAEFGDSAIAAAFDRFCDRWHGAGQWDAQRETIAAGQVRHLITTGFRVAELLDGAALAGKRDLLQYATSNEHTYGPKGAQNATGARDRKAGGSSLVERARARSGEQFDPGPPADYVDPEPTNGDFGPVTYA